MPPGGPAHRAAAAALLAFALYVAVTAAGAAADDAVTSLPQVSDATAPSESSPAPEPAAPEAEVEQGRMRGAVLHSRGGRPIYAFRGIPYAKPPLGDLRFRNPEPADPWEGVLDATKDGADCVQKNYLVPTYPVSGSEDCLFINVYTPKMSPPFNSLPVIVYIYGGGFFAGSGASYFNGPQYLLDHDVVLVTMNYRLGAIGFLSSGDARAPGNAGLKDQALALRWVRDNVGVFGGNPRAVTIMGQSAGGASVHLHMLSPLSRGLFHRAISQSGSALSAWARPVDPAPIALRQAEFLGCGATSMDDALSCLRSADAYVLTEAGHRFHFWSIDPLTVFRPVVEIPGPEAFLVDTPTAVMQSGDFAHVPWLTGAVPQEGIIRSLPILVNATLTSDLNARWDEIMPRLMELEYSAPEEVVPHLWRNISDFYFGDTQQPASLDNLQPFTDLYTDRAFLHGLRRSAELHARAGHKPIFLYEFAYRGNISYSLLFGGGVADYGVAHCDDLLYLLHAPVLFPDMPAEGTGDAKALQALTQLWVDFARHGNPTPHASTTTTTPVASTPRKATQCDNPSATETPEPATPSATQVDGAQDGHGACWSSVAETRWAPYEPASASAEDLELSFLRIEAASAAPDQLRFCMRKGLHRRRVNFWRSLPISENKRMQSVERLLRPFFYLVGVLF